MLGNLEANEKRHGCLRNQQFAIKVSLVITFVKLKNKHHWNRALPSLGQKLPLQFFLYCYCYCRFTGGDNEVIPKQRMVATCSVTLFSFGLGGVGGGGGWSMPGSTAWGGSRRIWCTVDSLLTWRLNADLTLTQGWSTLHIKDRFSENFRDFLWYR